jgi:hypothetical protein
LSVLALVGVHAFEVCEHGVTLERMAMCGACVIDDGVGNEFFVFADEGFAAPRTRLLVWHEHDPGDVGS